PVDDVALGGDDAAEVGEFAAGLQQRGDEVFLFRGQELFLDLLELFAELVGDGLVEVDDGVEDVVGDAVGRPGEAAGGLAAAVHDGVDSAQLGAAEGDDEIAAEEEIEFGGGELLG